MNEQNHRYIVLFSYGDGYNRYIGYDDISTAMSYLDYLGNFGIAIVDSTLNTMVWYNQYFGYDICEIHVNSFIKSVVDYDHIGLNVYSLLY